MIDRINGNDDKKLKRNIEYFFVKKNVSIDNIYSHSRENTKENKLLYLPYQSRLSIVSTLIQTTIRVQ